MSFDPNTPVKRPSPERIARNRAVARAHDHWVKSYVDASGFHPEAHPKAPSDYNVNHLDVDGATPSQEDHFFRLVEAEMSNAAPGAKSLNDRVTELAYKVRIVRTPEGEDRFGVRIGGIIGGHTFMNKDKVAEEFGPRRWSGAYSGDERVTAYENAVLVHQSTPGDYEEDVHAILHPDAAEDIAKAIHEVMTGLHQMSQNDPEEVVADEHLLVAPLTVRTSDGATVGVDPEGQVFVSYLTDNNYGSDDNWLSWDDAGRLMQALGHGAAVARHHVPPSDEIDEDPNGGYDIEDGEAPKA